MSCPNLEKAHAHRRKQLYDLLSKAREEWYHVQLEHENISTSIEKEIQMPAVIAAHNEIIRINSEIKNLEQYEKPINFRHLHSEGYRFYKN